MIYDGNVEDILHGEFGFIFLYVDLSRKTRKSDLVGRAALFVAVNKKESYAEAKVFEILMQNVITQTHFSENVSSDFLKC